MRFDPKYYDLYEIYIYGDAASLAVVVAAVVFCNPGGGGSQRSWRCMRRLVCLGRALVEYVFLRRYLSQTGVLRVPPDLQAAGEAVAAQILAADEE